MDSALKQRLLGAAVLIALAIIFVPMFLSNTPQQRDNTTLNLDIPKAPERKFETRTLPVEPAAAPAPVQPAAPDPNKVVTVDTKAPPKVDARPEDSAAPAAKPTDSKPTAAKPEAAAPTAASPPADTAAASDGRFAVNLGVYADHAHADALVAKLKKLGFAAAAEAAEYQGKPATRVRVGPFADRAAAESARLKIKQAEPKVASSVMESNAQPTADAPAPAVANRAGGWAVQLGAFKSEAEANKLRDRLRTGGVASFVDRAGSGEDALWRVRAGPYADRAGAETARTSIDDKFKVKGLVVTQP
jgi:DedD protein